MSKSIFKALPVWLLVIFFTVGGVINIAAPGGTVEDYVRWGYPAWFHYVTGIMELATALLLAYAPTRRWGLALGSTVMLGALATLLLHGEFMHSLPSAIVLLVLSFVASQTLRPRIFAAPPAKRM